MSTMAKTPIPPMIDSWSMKGGKTICFPLIMRCNCKNSQITHYTKQQRSHYTKQQRSIWFVYLSRNQSSSMEFHTRCVNFPFLFVRWRRRRREMLLKRDQVTDCCCCLQRPSSVWMKARAADVPHDIWKAAASTGTERGKAGMAGRRCGSGRYPCGAAAGEHLRAPSAAPPASEPAPEISPRAPASAQGQIVV
jgi:hypothetical protein